MGLQGASTFCPNAVVYHFHFIFALFTVTVGAICSDLILVALMFLLSRCCMAAQDRARAIYELAIAQPVLDMPEVLWKVWA